MMNPVQPVDVQPGKYKAQSEVMAAALIQTFGFEHAIGCAASLLEELLVITLHQETPMVEVNIASIESMLDKLKERVMIHKTCALDINKIDPKKVS